MIRIRWGAVSLLAAGAVLVSAAGAQACDLSALGVHNVADDGTDVGPGDSIRITGVRLGSEAAPGEPIKYSASVRDHGAVVLTLADHEPVPPSGRLERAFPIGDLGDQPRDLDLYLEVYHSGGVSKSYPFTYLQRSSPGPSEPGIRADQPANTPATAPGPPTGQQPSGNPTPGSNAAHGTETTHGGRVHSHSAAHHGTPSEHRTASQSNARQSTQAANTVAAKRTRDRRVAGASREPLARVPSRSTANQHQPAAEALSPRPERADDRGTSPLPPGVAATAPERPVESDTPAVIVALLLGSGIAVLLRSRLRPTGEAAIVPAPLPPRLPAAVAVEVLTGDPPATPLPDPLEVELQEMLAEHAAQERATPRAARATAEPPARSTA